MDEVAHTTLLPFKTHREIAQRKLVLAQDALLNSGTTFARLRFTLGPVASHPIPLSPDAEVTAANFFSRKP
jgi:hypothetical protein